MAKYMAAASARKDEQALPTFVVRACHSVGSLSPKKTAAAPISLPALQLQAATVPEKPAWRRNPSCRPFQYWAAAGRSRRRAWLSRKGEDCQLWRNLVPVEIRSVPHPTVFVGCVGWVRSCNPEVIPVVGNCCCHVACLPICLLCLFPHCCRLTPAAEDGLPDLGEHQGQERETAFRQYLHKGDAERIYSSHVSKPYVPVYQPGIGTMDIAVSREGIHQTSLLMDDEISRMQPGRKR
eukprot:3578588-Rhodomonas_salina.1